MAYVYVVGQYKSGDFPNIIWDLTGVFSSRKNAVNACKSDNYFVAKMTVNEISPEETTVFPNIEFPKEKA